MSISRRIGAGGTVLSLLAAPHSVSVLRAHLDGPLRLLELCERIGHPAAGVREQVSKLRDAGALERHVRPGMPYTVENGLTDLGHQMLSVAELLEVWLERRPQGPIALGDKPAKGVIAALIGGWESGMLSKLANGPHALTELAAAIPDFSYPSIERRLSAMRTAHLVKALPQREGTKPYETSPWLRQTVASLFAAARCESRYLPRPVGGLAHSDVETGLLLALPLVLVVADRSGSCLLVVSNSAGTASELSGIHIEIEGGRISRCGKLSEPSPQTWAAGPVDAWIATLVDDAGEAPKIGGADPALAEAVLASLGTTFSSN
jgi:DNA-binding HxlR family transcriptional regulator